MFFLEFFHSKVNNHRSNLVYSGAKSQDDNNMPKLMLLNCGVGEDSWESSGLQGVPTGPS